MIYYCVRQENSDILAIHQIYDAAKAVFYSIIKRDPAIRYIELMRVHTDEFGKVFAVATTHSYSNNTRIVIHYETM
jgi:hypothetical protein